MAVQPGFLERPSSRPVLRQRSSTMTSLTSSYKSPTTSFTSNKSSDRISREVSNETTSAWDRPESAAKTLLSRGSRILKRQGSKLNLGTSFSGNDDQWERQRKAVEVRELLHRNPKGRSKSAVGKNETIKKSISAPFDFQHVTHTHSSHFKALERVSNNELVTEFTAIRAAQRPKTELKGIQADNIQNQSPSSECFPDYNRPSTSAGIASDTPVTPPHRPSFTHSKSSPGLVLRQSRSIENFSRPTLRSPTSPVTPPTRRSSRNACPASIVPDPSATAVEAILGVNAQDTASLPSPTSRVLEKGSYVDKVAVGHAVTTLDDSIQMLRSIPFAGQPSNLAEVPEEDEQTRLHESTVPQSHHKRSSSLRRSQSFPSIRTSSDFRPPNAQYTSQSYDSFETIDSQLPTMSDIPPLEKRRISIGFKEIDINGWEDDIDYCYEHAAEADCDFDWWEKSATDEDQVAHQRQLEGLEMARGLQEEHARVDRKSAVFVRANSDIALKALRPSQLVPSHLGIPELDPPSAKSAASLQDALTPKTLNEDVRAFGMLPHINPINDMVAQSRAFFAKDDKSHVDEETMYEDMLAGQNQVDDYTFIHSRHSRISPPESRRSSHLSQCNSQESMLPSRAPSIRQKHQSSNSCASLPDLVHSLTNSRETINADPLDLTDPNAVPLYRSLSHKRARSLAGSALKKVASENSFVQADAPHPLGVLEEVSPTSEDSAMASSFDLPEATGPTFATRMRSASSALRGTGRASKATYSLYPTSMTTPATASRV